MAPYLLQWHGMPKELKEDASIMILWGLPTLQINDRLSGVSDFKLKFGG